MTSEETIEFERLKTARDSLLLTVANLRGQIETIAAKEREACASVADEWIRAYPHPSKVIAERIRERGQA